MDTQLQSISKIFTEKLYRIPDYQRGYAWTLRQLADFWGDIVQLEDDKNHYVGVLTLESVNKEIYSRWDDDLWIIRSKSFVPYYIVDGQQRLTTSIILIQCIIESVKSNEKLNYTSIKNIKEKYLFDSKDDGISRSYIFGYEKDNPSYEYLKTKIFNEPSVSGYQREETIYTQNLAFAKFFFKDQLATMKLPQKEAIFKKVTQNLLFNIYSISSDIDVFVAFETMNNRGKPLSVLELLKNRLIYLSVRIDAAEHEKEKLRKNINECWKSVYHYLGQNKENPLSDDTFLVNHLLIYFSDITTPFLSKLNSLDGMFDARRHHNYVSNKFETLLLDDIFTSKRLTEKSPSRKSKLTIKFINDYITSLQKSVMIWYDLHNPQQAKTFSDHEIVWIEKIARIGYKNASTLLLAYFSARPLGSDASSFLAKLENVMFLQAFFLAKNFSTQSIPNWIGIKFVKKEIGFSEIEQMLDRTILDQINDPFFINNIGQQFKGSGFYRWRGIYYFMFEYELYLHSKTKNKRTKINWNDFTAEYEDSATIEHIYPQNASLECFKVHFSSFSPQMNRNLVDSLGNLVAVSKPKNSSLQNKCFGDKVGIGTKVGYRNGSYSEIEVAQYPDWSPQTILERGLHLLDFMSHRWNIDFGTMEDRAAILNLKPIYNKTL